MIERVRISRPSRWARPSVIMAALALSSVLTGRASADFTIEIAANTNAVAGSANNAIDVFLVSDTATTLSGFEVTLMAPSGSGINFTGGDTNTGQPYVFSGNSVGFAFLNPSGPNTADISDFASNLNQSIAANTIYGLGEIFFSVDSGATPGMYPLSYLSSTSLTGGPPDYFNLPFATTSGQITVTPASVPEPAPLVMMGIGIAIASLARIRRRRVM